MAIQKDPQRHHEHSFPWSHVIGYILSLIMTFGALGLVLDTPALSKTFVVTAIAILAFFQALVQLLMFMHLNESTESKFQTILLAFGFFLALCIVFGSIWIMGFSSRSF